MLFATLLWCTWSNPMLELLLSPILAGVAFCLLMAMKADSETYRATYRCALREAARAGIAHRRLAGSP